ncbi:unnamed protein product [Urochloa humidicola]
MAPPRGGLKGHYRQRKKATKPAPKKKPKNAQTQEGVAAEEEQYGAEEEALRQFDMDTSYGPCIGVTRLRRWDRAVAMGLRPPPHVRDLILRHHHQGGDGGGCFSLLLPKEKNSDSSSSLQQIDECLWAGKV